MYQVKGKRKWSGGGGAKSINRLIYTEFEVQIKSSKATQRVIRKGCYHQLLLDLILNIQMLTQESKYNTSSAKWSNPGHFLKAQGKFIFSFPEIFLTHKNYKLSL